MITTQSKNVITVSFIWCNNRTLPEQMKNWLFKSHVTDLFKNHDNRLSREVYYSVWKHYNKRSNIYLFRQSTSLKWMR